MYISSFLMVGVCASLFHMAIVDCLNKKSKKETKWPDLSLRKQVEKAFSYSKNKMTGFGWRGSEKCPKNKFDGF